MPTVLEVQVNELSPTVIRILIDIEVEDSTKAIGASQLGSGPTGSAIPDEIVRFLMAQSPSDVGLDEIRAAVGGNPSTINRQAWTLATNAPDLQHRLRGWVVKTDRGRYRLSDLAQRRLEENPRLRTLS